MFLHLKVMCKMQKKAEKNPSNPHVGGLNMKLYLARDTSHILHPFQTYWGGVIPCICLASGETELEKCPPH